MINHLSIKIYIYVYLGKNEDWTAKKSWKFGKGK